MQGNAPNDGQNIVAQTHWYFSALFSEKHRELAEVKKNKPGWIGYSPIFTVALFKDMLDLALVGSLPGIGAVVTLCFSGLIFLMLMLVRTNKKLIDSRFLIKRGVVLLLGSLTEGFIFGLNFLPIMTITIAIIYMMDRHLSDKQIEKIIKILQELHGEQASAMRTARRMQMSSDAENMPPEAPAQVAEPAGPVPQSKYSQAADWIPVVGSVKMIAEAKKGKLIGGGQLSGAARVRHGVAGGAFLAADLTAVGEVVRAGKLVKVGLKLGEKQVARAAGKRAIREGERLYERGKERSTLQRQYAAVNDQKYEANPTRKAA
jgi:hypothetical protein